MKRHAIFINLFDLRLKPHQRGQRFLLWHCLAALLAIVVLWQVAGRFGTAAMTSNRTLPATAAKEMSRMAYVGDVTGTVFEDVNYGGGAGRTLANSAGQPVTNARVELYDSAGNFVSFTTTNGSGQYSFPGLAAGSYTVRVVNGSVRSTRAGGAACSTCLPVQTFRTNASSGTAVAVTDHVGGAVPSKVDAGNGSTTLAALTTATTTAQSIAVVTVSGGNISGVDFGFNFDTIVNINDSGQGAYRQFVTTQP